MSGSVVCVGVFDGVHCGHRSLIAQARVEADRAGLPLVAVTFWPHPAAVLRPADAPRSLATIEDRCKLLRAAGADEVDVLRFDDGLAALTAEEFAVMKRHTIDGAEILRGTPDVPTLAPVAGLITSNEAMLVSILVHDVGHRGHRDTENTTLPLSKLSSL